MQSRLSPHTHSITIPIHPFLLEGRTARMIRFPFGTRFAVARNAARLSAIRRLFHVLILHGAAWLGQLAIAEELPRLEMTLTWIESPAGQPVIDRGPAGAWNHYAVDNPFVLADGGTFLCFYEGQDKPYSDGGHHLLFRGMKSLYREQGLGVAVSSDLTNWRRFQDNPVIPVEEEIASMAVAQTHDGFVGIEQNILHRAGRSYWLSQDLIHWRKGPAARFSCPSVDTLSDPFRCRGRWTVLYEQTDRIYRAVLGP